MLTMKLVRLAPSAAVGFALLSVILSVVSHVHSAAAPAPVWMHE